MRAMALSGAFVLLVVGFWLGAVVANMTPEPATGYSRDLYAYFFPRFVYEARAVWAGRIPLWNPHELCGAPFLASAQSGVLNPLTVLVFGLAPAPVALHVYYVLHSLLAGFATYLFCRAADLGWQGAQLLPTAELVRESARDVLTARPVLAPGPAALRTLFGLRRDVGLAYVSMLPALYLGALPLVLAACGGLLGRSRLRAPFAACALV